MSRVSLSLFLAALLALAIACGDQEEPGSAPGPTADETGEEPRRGSPNARPEVHQQFLDDLALERHPADGGGSARLVLAEGEDGSVRSGGFGRWEFEYTAGSEGIAEGGSLFLLVPPFWGWSTPQVEAPHLPGFTTVEVMEDDAQGAGLELLPRTVDRNLLQVEVVGRGLREGERLRIVYGAGEGLAKADDYAEESSCFYFKVDGDGDGLSGLVDSRPAIRVLAGSPARMTATLPTTAAPGDSLELTLAVLDAMANAGCEVAGELRLESVPPGLELPERIALESADAGLLRVPLSAGPPGIYRLRARLTAGELELEALSNPLVVGENLTPVFWADLHGHSNYSDGTATPRQYFEYARDVAALDVVVLTDHDHFGVRFLDATPEIWAEIRGVVQELHDPGRFVSLLGFEWTSWLYGHRHVVYFDGQGEVLSSVGGNTTTPAELWDALRGEPALTFSHHSAGGPVATDWSFRPDPVLEPVTEIMSVHGSSEALDSPARIRGAVRGNFVRDQLDRGYVLGFVGSGDSHDGHPGHAHLSPNAGYRRVPPDPRGRRASERMGNGGLAAVRATSLDAESVLEAIRERAVYATSGPRIWIDVRLAGRPMGSSVSAAEVGGETELVVEVAGTTGLEYLELVRRGAETRRQPLEGELDLALRLPLEGLTSGDYVYVRLLQRDGSLGWSSPIFVVD